MTPPPEPSPPPATRVVVLCCDGLYQRHLIRRAAEEFTLVGAVIQHAPAAAGGRWSRLMPYRDPRRLRRQLEARLFLPRYEHRGEALRRELFWRDGAPAPLPADLPVLETTAINGADTVAFLRRHAPDLVLVNGTQLLRQPVLDLIPAIRHGIVNLHTGLSPYSRGANCNLYMLLEGHPEMVGVTVHHIDAGIDSGDIIRSARVPFEAEDNFETVDVRSFHVGVELLLQAAHELVEGRAQRVPQWERGKLFLRRTGYDYEPWQRLAANRLCERGLIRDYLARREERDRGVRLVGDPP